MKKNRLLSISSADNKDRIEAIIDKKNYENMFVELDVNNLDDIVNINADAIIVYDENFEDSDAKFVEKLYMSRNGIIVILITGACDMDTLSKAMQSGVKKVLTLDMGNEKINDEIASEIIRSQNRGMETGTSRTNAKVISVFGTKGGTGKTTMSVNLAMSLQKTKKRVAIIDLDLQFGDVGVFLNVPKFDTILDLVSEGVYNAVTVNSYLYKHDSGLKILCAPNSPEYSELIKPEHISQIVEVMKPEFDYIIIDLGPIIDDCALQALDISDNIFFITNPEISTLKNTKTCIGVLDKIDLKEKTKIILNKSGNSDVTQRDMEAALGMEMALVVPDDAKNTILAINRGIPLVIAAPRSKASKAITKFVESGNI